MIKSERKTGLHVKIVSHFSKNDLFWVYLPNNEKLTQKLIFLKIDRYVDHIELTVLTFWSPTHYTLSSACFWISLYTQHSEIRQPHDETGKYTKYQCRSISLISVYHGKYVENRVFGKLSIYSTTVLNDDHCMITSGLSLDTFSSSMNIFSTMNRNERDASTLIFRILPCLVMRLSGLRLLPFLVEGRKHFSIVLYQKSLVSGLLI